MFDSITQGLQNWFSKIITLSGGLQILILLVATNTKIMTIVARLLNRLIGQIGLFLFSLSITTSYAFAADTKKEKLIYEDSKIKVRVITRSPKQIAAFYEGREFSQKAIKETSQYCFPAVIVINKTADILWLDLNDWQFLSNDKVIKRIKRGYWKQRWNAIGLSNAHQATFGWTLMPDIRNLQVDEGVGGSIPIEMQSHPYTLHARFRTGQNKQGSIISVTLHDIPCPKDDEKT